MRPAVSMRTTSRPRARACSTASKATAAGSAPAWCLIGFKLIKHQAGADPAAVAFDAVEHARARGRDVVLIDTAGRMQTNQNLMDQMKKIQRVAKPHLVVFVGDALAGNDAVEQARTFQEAVGFDAAILCKIDADAKGGAALSIAHAVGAPILFVGTGQGYEALTPFDP